MALYPTADFTDFRGAVVADVNNDNIKDVTFASYWGKVISLDGATGVVIRSFDTRAYAADSLGNTSSIYEIDNAPIIADFDHDGVLDVFVIGGKGRSDTSTYNDYGYAFCLSWGVGNGPDWLMFRHDAQRTGCLCDVNGLPLYVGNDNSVTSEQPRVFPNPASGAFTVVYSNSGDRQGISYSIVDMTGREVVPARQVVSEHGENSIAISTADIPNGNYLIRIYGETVNVHLQVTIVR